MSNLIKDFSFLFFPPTTKRGKWLKKQAISLGLAKNYSVNHAYQRWIHKNEPEYFMGPIENSIKKDKLPLLSIVIPTFNTKDKYLDQLFYTVINQSYTKWELILVDASTLKDRSSSISSYANQDKRIKYFKTDKNYGISGNTNVGLEHVKGDYVVFMDHDDTLSLHALNEVAICALENPKVEIIYSDEDKLSDDGVIRHTPHFKPDWSPHQYLSCNWTSHLSVVKTELIKKVGGLDPEKDGSQDYDLILRLLALPGDRVVRHIPKVLYHWRVAKGSTAGKVEEKYYAVEAGDRSLNDFLKSKHIKAKSEPISHRPGFHEIVFSPIKNRKALIIVNSAINNRQNLTFLNRLRDANSSLTQTRFITSAYFSRNKKQVLSSMSSQDCIFSINGAYKITNTKWVDQLCGVLELGNVRAVAPKVLNTDMSIIDMGIIIDSGEEKLLFEKQPHNADTVFGHTEWVRDVERVTGSFYGAKKEMWVHLQNGIKLLSKDSKAEGQYDVIWTHVTAIFIGSEQPVVAFNRNLNIDNNSKLINL